MKNSNVNKEQDSAIPAPLLFDNQLLNYEQAAKLLGVKPRTLLKWKADGSIPYVPIGTKEIRFRVSSLDRWINEREVS